MPATSWACIGKVVFEIKTHGCSVHRHQELWVPINVAWRLATWMTPRGSLKPPFCSLPQGHEQILIRREPGEVDTGREVWPTGRKWARVIPISSSWVATLSLSFRGTQPPGSCKLPEGYFSRRLLPSVELDLPWVFLTFPFYLASLEVEEVPEVQASEEGGMKEVAWFPALYAVTSGFMENLRGQPLSPVNVWGPLITQAILGAHGREGKIHGTNLPDLAPVWSMITRRLLGLGNDVFPLTL